MTSNTYILDTSVDEMSSSAVPQLLVKEESKLPVNSQSGDEIFSVQTRNGDSFPTKAEQKPVPVTILTGFLGSGKTTLLKHILQSKNLGRRIAIIENEFSGIQAESTSIPSGTLNIESLIVRDGSNQENISDLVELPNGCICCTVKDSLVTTLEILLKKKKNIDYIIIECSGMANPGPIASVLWLDDALQSNVVLDGIITMVDARNFDTQIKETSWTHGLGHFNQENQGGDEAAQQVAYADRIVINKIDQLNYDDEAMVTEKVDSIRGMIRAINQTAPISITTFSQIDDISWLLDTRSFSLERFYEKQTVSPDINQCNCCWTHCGVCSQSISDNITDVTKSEPLHSHTSSIKSVMLIQQGSAFLSKLNSWLATILWPDQDTPSKLVTYFENTEEGHSTTEKVNQSMKIFRIKGVLSVRLHTTESLGHVCQDDILYFDEEGVDTRRYIVQAVNDIWDIQPVSSDLCWKDEMVRVCTMVIIGRFLDEEVLRTGFLSCFQTD